MDDTQREVDEIRKERSEVENHIIDEYTAGRLSRRDFVRRGTVIGMSIPMVAFLAAACGGGGEETAAASHAPADTGGAETGAPAETTAPPVAGGTFRLGSTTPAATLNPVTVADQGGLVMNGLTGEFLALSLGEPELTPQLAESWTPNTDASEWTFKIRQGVTFSDGTPMTADRRRGDDEPPGRSCEQVERALGVRRRPRSRRQPRRPTTPRSSSPSSAPNGTSPTSSRSDNYNAIILPADATTGDWDNTFIGTGPFTRVYYTPKVGASLTRNRATGARRRCSTAIEFTFYADEQPHVLALVGRPGRRHRPVRVAGGQAILADTDSFQVIASPRSAHRSSHAQSTWSRSRTSGSGRRSR